MEHQMSLTQRQQQIKDEFLEVRGTWGQAWDAALRLDRSSSPAT